MRDGKYVPTEEDMKRYEDILKRYKSLFDCSPEEKDLVFRVFWYLNSKKKPSVKEIDEEIEDGSLRIDGYHVGSKSPFDRYCERVGYYDRHSNVVLNGFGKTES